MAIGVDKQDGESIQLTYPKKGESIVCEQTSNTYIIGEQIGEGNFGVVYACSDTWGNSLAVKVLKPKGTYQDVRNSCIKERDKLFLLRHPHITYLHDVFEYRNAFYIITERCSSTLASMMKIQNFDGRFWLRPVAHGILQAVHFIHTKGYLHQDIHVGNVFSTFIKDELLPEDNQALQFKIGDLGISRLIDEVTPESTMANWMRPPEMLDSVRFGRPDHRVDIYHLGLLFLQMILGGDIRFKSEDIINGRPEFIASQLNIPEGKVIARALTPMVSKRISSALALWCELDRVLPKN